jgi:flagellar hook-length control protein FliK
VAGSDTGGAHPARAAEPAPNSAVLTAPPTGAPVTAPVEAGALVAPGVPAPANVTGPQAATPAQPAAPAVPTPAAAQVAMHIAPLRPDADGIHRLTVHLHPVDLGPVQVVAEIRDGDISVRLTGGTDAGTEALRSSLDDLRRELTDSGFRNCSLDLRQGNTHQQARQQSAEAGTLGRRTDRGSGNGEVPVEPAPGATRRTVPSGRLDVHA